LRALRGPDRSDRTFLFSALVVGFGLIIAAHLALLLLGLLGTH
jgi:hypothetical protein